MDVVARIERTLEAALAPALAFSGPPRLGAAIRHAVFPGGARVRPRLCLAVAQACRSEPCRSEAGRSEAGRSEACGRGDNATGWAAAAALELVHCASLVHDDLPCFDDASLRRGLPSVHQVFGEALAVLAGDALIVLAFETLALAAAPSATSLAPLLLLLARSTGLPSVHQVFGEGLAVLAGDALIVLAFETLALAAAPSATSLAPLLLLLARSTGLPRGIIAGQAWECEPEIPLTTYHRAKTASLFSAATMAGALAAGAEAGPWHALGERLGEAYQVADDIRDIVATPSQLGKPSGRDQALGRPSMALQHGVAGAMLRLQALVDEAIAAIPRCAGAADLRGLIRLEVQRLLPREMLLHAA